MLGDLWRLREPQEDPSDNMDVADMLLGGDEFVGFAKGKVEP